MVELIPNSRNRFRFRMWQPQAKCVYLLGDFNDWRTCHPMVADAQGTWQIDLPLTSGLHRFRYLTDDGQWLTDWAAFGVERNKLGQWDSTLFVPEPAELPVKREPAPIGALIAVPHNAPVAAASAASLWWRFSAARPTTRKTSTRRKRRKLVPISAVKV